MAREGEKNGYSKFTDVQAIHIKSIFYVQFQGNKKRIGECINYIQKFYKFKYNTIYNVIFRRYKHLDNEIV